MTKVLILGATGSLGRHVTRQAVAANHEVATLVRTSSKLPAELREKGGRACGGSGPNVGL
jgi:uncharacterized protein YbjT (DUF2867 family)